MLIKEITTHTHTHVSDHFVVNKMHTNDLFFLLFNEMTYAYHIIDNIYMSFV